MTLWAYQPGDCVGAYEHNGDRALLERLGLRTWCVGGGSFTKLGTVVVQAAEPDGDFGPRPAATVDVEMAALPAQFWRFTITRPRDDAETVDGEVRGVYEPVERFVLTTGSGSFGGYWPMAEAIAQNVVTVEVVTSPA